MSQLTFFFHRDGEPSLRALPAQPLGVIGPRCSDDPSLSLYSFSLASTSLDVCTAVALLLWGHPLAGEGLTYRTSDHTGAGQNCPEGLMQRARCAFFVGLVAFSLFSVWVGPAASISLSDGVGTHSLPSFLRGRAPLPPLSSVESGPAHRGSSIGSARPRLALWRRSSVAPSANTLPPRGVCAECVPQQRSRGESPASLLLSSPSLYIVLHVHAFRRLHDFGLVCKLLCRNTDVHPFLGDARNNIRKHVS
jgi:hypothetical protein